MAQTRAQKNRQIRQDNMREQLASKQLERYVLDGIVKIDELANLNVKDFDSFEEYTAESSVAKDKVFMLKTAIEARLKLMNKYLPDLKQTEITGNPDAPLQAKWTVEFVNAEIADAPSES